MTTILIFLALGLSHPTQAAESHCPEKVRAIFDIGSGTTKMNSFVVQECPRSTTVVRELFAAKSRAVPLEDSKQAGRISKTAMEQLIRTVTEFKAAAIDRAKEEHFSQIEFAAAGTHAIRTAKNQNEVLKKITALGVPMVALTQAQEALVGFEGAKAKGFKKICSSSQNVAVWDIGGGSLEWTIAGELDGKPQVQGLPLGAESFKKQLIEKLNLHRPLRCLAKKETPNPIGLDHLQEGLNLADKEAGTLTYRPGLCVIGIGGVHTQAINAEIDKTWGRLKSCVCGKTECSRSRDQAYTFKEVDCLARLLVTKTDCDPELKGPYSTTNASNLLLVESFMHRLKIAEVHTLKINMGDGLAVDRGLLKFRTQTLTNENGTADAN